MPFHDHSVPIDIDIDAQVKYHVVTAELNTSGHETIADEKKKQVRSEEENRSGSGSGKEDNDVDSQVDISVDGISKVDETEGLHDVESFVVEHKHRLPKHKRQQQRRRSALAPNEDNIGDRGTRAQGNYSNQPVGGMKGRARRQCSSNVVEGLTSIAITPTQQYKATNDDDNDDDKDDGHDSTTSHVHAGHVDRQKTRVAGSPNKDAGVTPSGASVPAPGLVSRDESANSVLPGFQPPAACASYCTYTQPRSPV